MNSCAVLATAGSAAFLSPISHLLVYLFVVAIPKLTDGQSIYRVN